MYKYTKNFMQLIIDVGCNILEGFKKLESVENIHPTDKKIFVEANPECWDFLEYKIKDIPNSILLKNALDTEERVVDLITRADKKADTAATILGKSFIQDSLRRWNIEVTEYNTYNIQTVTIKYILDFYKDSFDKIILKLDAEGVEYNVLQQIIDNNITIHKIYCEFHVHSDYDEHRKQYIIQQLKYRNIEVFDWE